MTTEKQICFSICICQLSAILSGVSLLYLAVIVVIPAKNELNLNFNRTPIMCTTLETKDVADTDTVKLCTWKTCSEWCLSKPGKCTHITVNARNNGSRVNFRDCVDISNNTCSALDVNKTRPFYCKEGECKELTGLFFCERDPENPCKFISPAFECQSRSIDRNTILCDQGDACKERLIGVYTCKAGKCQKLNDIAKYFLDCERKCTRLEMRERNVIIFSTERLVATACTSMESPDNNTISEVSERQEWRDKKVALFIFCTYVKKVTGTTTYDLISSDCFNATMSEASDFQHLKEYITLKKLHISLGNLTEEWVIPPESELSVYNNTQLRINPEGCVNTLSEECKAFFKSHGHDGYDGMSQDRYICYFADQLSDYVIGQYNPDLSQLLLLLASIAPGCLFVFSCTWLFICSKSVGVDDEGHLKVILMSGTGGGADGDRVPHLEDLL